MNTGWADQPGIYYRKVIRKDSSEISLDADMIRLLLAIDENKSLYQVAEEVGMAPPAFKQTLAKLRKQGLIEPVKKDAPVLNEHFLGQLQANLSRAIGPMAIILIEDIVAEMELSISAIPIQQAAELINNLSLEIPDEDNRIQFKRSMLDILNKNRK